MTILHSAVRALVTLTDALAWAQITGVALLSSPTRYLVAQAAPNGCRHVDGPLTVEAVFDARVFDPHRELRWWHAGGGYGRAVLLSEKADLPDGDTDPVEPIYAHRVIDGGYLLWGRAVASAPAGWTSLCTARIGTLHIPVPGHTEPGPQRARLDTREYVAVEEHHGNAYVAEERLVRLHLIDVQN